ncbi:MAG: ABC transporter permease, partial [Bacteroidota bacterium]
MIFNHLKLAWRQLTKYKFYSLINIGGLSIGVACCIIILLYIQYELSYDAYHENADDIYRVALDINLNQSDDIGIAVPAPLGPTMEQDLPEVVKAARINVFFDDAGSNIVRASNQTEGSFQKGFVYIDPEFGDLFSFEALKGNPATWLEQPNSIVITESVAKQFFGDTNPIDQSFILNEDPEDQYRITGVIKDLPKNTHLDYDYFMSMSTLPSSESNNWISNAYFAYVQLAENAEPAVLQDKLYDFGLK